MVGCAKLESIVAVVPALGTAAMAFVARSPPTLAAAALMPDCGPASAFTSRELVLSWLSALAHCAVLSSGVFSLSAGRVTSSLAV